MRIQPTTVADRQQMQRSVLCLTPVPRCPSRSQAPGSAVLCFVPCAAKLPDPSPAATSPPTRVGSPCLSLLGAAQWWSRPGPFATTPRCCLFAFWLSATRSARAAQPSATYRTGISTATSPLGGCTLPLASLLLLGAALTVTNLVLTLLLQ